MSLELRCPSKKFGELIPPSTDEGIIEVLCPSRFCGKMGPTIVLHRFSTSSGKLLDTKYFSDPARRKLRK